MTVTALAAGPEHLNEVMIDAACRGTARIASRTRGSLVPTGRAAAIASGGLLQGTSGIQLAQNDLPRTGGEPPAWDACLLLAL